MRSSEIAKVAGVSVRTLRHYHALGLLPEPPRHANGYRDYDAMDLARLLRIKRLAALGFPLSDVKAMLDAEGEGAEGASGTAEALDQLDAELALQIERLQEQRRTIATLRAEQLDPALPMRFAQLIRRLYGPAIDAGTVQLTDYDNAALAVAGHLYDESDLQELERFTSKVEELGLLEALYELELRMGQLSADATERERAALVDDALALMRPLVSCFRAENWEDGPDDGAQVMLDALLDASSNAARADVGRRIEEAIAEEVRRQTAERG